MYRCDRCQRTPVAHHSERETTDQIEAQTFS